MQRTLGQSRRRHAGPAELAAWLSQALAKNGIVTSYPSEEDWGWYLLFPDGDVEYQICCSGSAEGAEYEWRVFVSPITRMFRKKPPGAMQEELLDSVIDCLRESGIEVSVEAA
jgi:hypothetical protein